MANDIKSYIHSFIPRPLLCHSAAHIRRFLYCPMSSSHSNCALLLFYMLYYKQQQIYMYINRFGILYNCKQLLGWWASIQLSWTVLPLYVIRCCHSYSLNINLSVHTFYTIHIHTKTNRIHSRIHSRHRAFSPKKEFDDRVFFVFLYILTTLLSLFWRCTITMYVDIFIN